MLSPEQAERLRSAGGEGATARIPVSALTGAGMAELLDVLEREIGRDLKLYEVELPPEEGAALSWLYRHGEVADRQADDAGRMTLSVRLRPADFDRFRKLHPAGARRSGQVG